MSTATESEYFDDHVRRPSTSSAESRKKISAAFLYRRNGNANHVMRRGKHAEPPIFDFSAALNLIDDKTNGIMYEKKPCNKVGVVHKILSYHSASILLKILESWRILLARSSFRSTVFIVRGAWVKCLFFTIVAILMFYVSMPVHANKIVIGDIRSLRNSLNTAVTFLLTYYVTHCVQRWHDITMNHMGTIRSKVTHIYEAFMVIQSHPDCAERPPEVAADRRKNLRLVKRYLLAFHALLYKDLHDEDDMEDLRKRRLLSPFEIEKLKTMGGYRCVALLNWISGMASAVLTSKRSLGVYNDQQTIYRVPAEVNNLGITTFDLKDLVQVLIAKVNRQQPYAYVHLLALIVDITLFVNAASVGLQYGSALGPCISSQHSHSPTATEDVVDCDDRWEMAIIISCACFTVLSLPFLYCGLLAIGTKLEDPMGVDACDEPALFNQFQLEVVLEDIDHAYEAVEDKKWWEKAADFSMVSSEPLAMKKTRWQTFQGTDVKEKRVRIGEVGRKFEVEKTPAKEEI